MTSVRHAFILMFLASGCIRLGKFVQTGSAQTTCAATCPKGQACIGAQTKACADASALTLSLADPGVRGAGVCAPLSVEILNGGAPAALVTDFAVTFASPAGKFFSDDKCSKENAQAAIAVGAATGTIFFIPSMAAGVLGASGQVTASVDASVAPAVTPVTASFEMRAAVVDGFALDSGFCWLLGAGAAGMQCTGRNFQSQLRNDPQDVVGKPAPLSSAPTVLHGGQDFVCGIANGGALCNGTNNYGVLGTMMGFGFRAPQGLSSGVTDVCSGQGFSCAIAGGAVSCWGQNFSNQLGVPSSSTPTNEADTPITISGSFTAMPVALACGADFACARTSDGKVACWGNNGRGQIGQGTSGGTISAPATVLVGASTPLTNVSKISAGAEQACVLSGPEVWCWGRGAPGTAAQVFAIQVTGGGLTDNTFDVSVGINHACVVDLDTAYCWGKNAFGAIGTGTATATSISTPAAVVGLPGKPSRIVAGGSSSLDTESTCAIVYGVPYCWGANFYAELGVVDLDASTTPTLSAVGGGNAQNVALSRFWGNPALCIVSTSGGVSCLGANDIDQLGNGVEGLAGSSAAFSPAVGLDSGVSQIELSNGAACVIQAGHVLCWGSGNGRQLGIASDANFNTPTLAAVPGTATRVSLGGQGGCVVVAGAASPIYCWGTGDWGRLGDGPANDFIDNVPPVAVTGLADVTAVHDVSAGAASSCAVVDTAGSAGQVRCWGADNSGALSPTGGSGQPFSDVPVTAPLGLGATAVTTTGDGACAIMTDTSLRCWGGSTSLGGSATQFSSPPSMSSGVTQVRSGGSNVCALRSGNLYCWGDNSFSQVKASGSANAPTKVQGLVQPIRDFGIGPSFQGVSACALDAEGLKCWGSTFGRVTGNGVSFVQLAPRRILPWQP